MVPSQGSSHTAYSQLIHQLTLSHENVWLDPLLIKQSQFASGEFGNQLTKLLASFCRGTWGIVFQSCKHLCLRPGMAKALAHRHRVTSILKIEQLFGDISNTEDLPGSPLYDNYIYLFIPLNHLSCERETDIELLNGEETSQMRQSDSTEEAMLMRQNLQGDEMQKHQK